MPPGLLSGPLRVGLGKANYGADGQARSRRRSVQNMIPVGDEVDLEPASSVLAAGAAVVMTYDPLLVGAAGTREDSLLIWCWDPLGQQWQPLPSIIDKKANTLTTQAARCAIYQVAAPGRARPGH